MSVARPDQVNGRPVDAYTLLHIAAGAAFAGLRVPARVTFGLGLVWEIVEPSLKRNFEDAFPRPAQDRVMNKITDTLAVGVGWWLGRALLRLTDKQYS